MVWLGIGTHCKMLPKCRWNLAIKDIIEPHISSLVSCNKMQRFVSFPTTNKKTPFPLPVAICSLTWIYNGWLPDCSWKIVGGVFRWWAQDSHYVTVPCCIYVTIIGNFNWLTGDGVKFILVTHRKGWMDFFHAWSVCKTGRDPKNSRKAQIKWFFTICPL